MLPEGPRELFRIWAPEHSRWSAWAKPVLFTYSADFNLPPAPPPQDHVTALRLDDVPRARSGAALVVDMPGAAGVACGLALAERGYRPVPLYNVTVGPGENLIDVKTILKELRKSAPTLGSLRISEDAPPAFLIDSRRLDGIARPLTYDNRWMVFPQDFPSARELASAGISRIIVIREPSSPIRSDLRAVLRLWKRDGIGSAQLDPVNGETSELTFDLSLWAVLLDHLSGIWHGLRENSAGGFGGVVPMPGSARGFG